MSPYQLRQLKRAFRRFWKEWGMNKDEFFWLATCNAMILGIMAFSTIMTAFF